MPGELTLSRYVVASDALTTSRVPRARRLVFSTRSGEILILDDALWTLVHGNRIERLPEGIRARLVEARVLVDASEDELAAIIGENLRAIAAHDVLYQVVQPTAWCQLGCHYCGQAHTRRQLDPCGQDAFLERVRTRLASGGYRELLLGWFGAEPLAGLPVIRRLSAEAHKLAASFGCDYAGRIVTNGLALTPAIARELVEELHVREAEITLDGLADAHDQRRATKRGKGTFERIFGNLHAVAAATPLHLTVRCNVDHTNADAVAPLIEALAEAGLVNRVRFYTSPVYAWGNDAHLAALTREGYAERELDWLALQLRLGFRVGLIPPRRKIVCMSVQRDAEVIDAYGASYNCTEVPYVPAYGTPSLYQISLRRPAPMAAPARALRDFNQRVLARALPSCPTCPMLPVCGGQCPKAWQEDHEPCPSAKLNMRQRLNLLLALDELEATP